MNKKSNLLLAALLAAMLAVLLITGVGIVSAQEEGPEEPAPQAQTPPTTMQTVYDILQSEPSLASFKTLVDAAALHDNLQQARMQMYASLPARMLA